MELSTVIDYANRQADMLAFHGIFPQMRGKNQLLSQELVRPGSGGELIAGIEKLAQRVLLILLTKVGSKQYAATEGTTFMVDAQLGRWRTPADVSESFYSARLDVSRQCRAIETDEDPVDERWGSLDLDGVTLSGDKVSIRLVLVSAAGATYKFLTPVSVPIN